VMKRVPVAFNAGFVPQQRLFYSLEAMGKLDELHGKVFHAIHAERMPLNQDDSILDWAGKQGLDKAKFTEIYNSFDVVTKVRRAIQLQDAFKVQGVPSLGVQGRYYTDGTLAGNTDRLLQVADYLIAQARKST
jgi:protein dithiol oxidoreductase (disulfide-forming)